MSLFDDSCECEGCRVARVAAALSSCSWPQRKYSLSLRPKVIHLKSMPSVTGGFFEFIFDATEVGVLLKITL